MLRRILIGLNGSEYSLSATELGIALARRHHSLLLGIGVVDLPQLTAAQPVPLGAGAYKGERDAAVTMAAHLKIDQVLSDFSVLSEKSGVTAKVEKHVGSPAEILVEQAQTCDLLVVGKRHMPTKEWEQSSRTLEQLLRYAPRPIVCVPTARTNDSSVLIAYDGSLQAARTLHAFVQSGLGMGRELHVASLGRGAQVHANLANQYLLAHALAPHLLVEETASHPARRLLEIAQQFQAGMIVLGCYGQPKLKEFIFGSTTRGILAETTVPLFLYH